MFLGDHIIPRKDIGIEPAFDAPIVYESSSNTSMQLPPSFDSDYDDDYQHIPVTAERRLYLAVFSSAFGDLLSGKGDLRDKAIEWFKGILEGTPITYAEVLSMFDFNAGRLKKLKAYIDDSIMCKNVRLKIRRRNETNK